MVNISQDIVTVSMDMLHVPYDMVHIYMDMDHDKCPPEHGESICGHGQVFMYMEHVSQGMLNVPLVMLKYIWTWCKSPNTL